MLQLRQMPQLLPGPWNPRDATDRIRAIAQCDDLTLTYKLHAQERLSERGLILSDILYLLKNGFVHENAVPATRAGYNRYLMVSRTPNSGARTVGVVVIPDQSHKHLKLVTIMWIDEAETRAGSIIGDDA